MGFFNKFKRLRNKRATKKIRKENENIIEKVTETDIIEKDDELSNVEQVDKIDDMKINNDNRSKEDILSDLGLKERKMQINIFDKSVSVTFTKGLEDTIEQLVECLERTISQYMNELCKESVENAVEFIEWTGEALHFMLDPEDEPEYIDEFMKQWNSGEIKELVSFYDRWYSIENATKIAQECQKLSKSKEITIHELHQLASEAVLKLKLYEYNFGNVYLAMKEQLEHEPKEILKFMHLMGVHVEQTEDKTLLFTIEFQNDWEVEHGIDWIIKDTKPIYVGQGGASFSNAELLEWDTLRGCSR